MNIKPIRTERDYQVALQRIEHLMSAELGTQEGDELEILAILIEKYEEEQFPILPPDPISAIRFRLEQMGMNQSDFAKIVGANRASEILSGKRPMAIGQIKLIHQELGIPYENLLSDEQPQGKHSAH